MMLSGTFIKNYIQELYLKTEHLCYEYPYDVLDFHDYSRRVLIIKAPLGTIAPEYFFSFFYSKKLISRCTNDYLDDYLSDLLTRINLKIIKQNDFQQWLKLHDFPNFIFSYLDDFYQNTTDQSFYEIYPPYDNIEMEACWLIICKHEILLVFDEIYDFSYDY